MGKHEAGPEHVADAGRAFYARAPGLQAGYVPVEGSETDAGFLGEPPAADRLAITPQHLHEIEQTWHLSCARARRASRA